jgi:hypothetical protein
VEGLVWFIAFLAALAVTVGGLVLLASRIRRRGIGDTVMGPFDEVWHPTAHRAHIEIREQEERTTPAPTPSVR